MTTSAMCEAYCGTRGRQGDERERQEKQDADDERRHPGTATLLDTCGGFDVRRHRRGSQHPADRGADCVGHQRLIDVREVALLVEEATDLPDADEGSGGVEEVHEEEREDDESEGEQSADGGQIVGLEAGHERSSEGSDVVRRADHARSESPRCDETEPLGGIPDVSSSK